MKAWGICCCSVGNGDYTQTDIKPVPLNYTPHYSLKQHTTFMSNISQSNILLILYSFLVQVLDHRITATAQWKKHNWNQCFYSNSRLKPKTKTKWNGTQCSGQILFNHQDPVWLMVAECLSPAERAWWGWKWEASPAVVLQISTPQCTSKGVTVKCILTPDPSRYISSSPS